MLLLRRIMIGFLLSGMTFFLGVSRAIAHDEWNSAPSAYANEHPSFILLSYAYV